MAFTSLHLFFDDVAVGQAWESPGRTITEADVVNFAGLSGDFNAIHMDEEFARSTPYHGRIAHGLLILAVAGGLNVSSPPMRTLALLSLDSWEFRNPVFLGDTVRVRNAVAAKEPGPRGRRGKITWAVQVLKQDQTVVQEGRLVTLVEGRGARACVEKNGACRNGTTSQGVEVPVHWVAER
jgi:3-hydroxybutyryl-CoA dehydratase